MWSFAARLFLKERKYWKNFESANHSYSFLFTLPLPPHLLPRYHLPASSCQLLKFFFPHLQTFIRLHLKPPAFCHFSTLLKIGNSSFLYCFCFPSVFLSQIVSIHRFFSNSFSSNRIRILSLFEWGRNSHLMSFWGCRFPSQPPNTWFFTIRTSISIKKPSVTFPKWFCH